MTKLGAEPDVLGKAVVYPEGIAVWKLGRGAHKANVGCFCSPLESTRYKIKQLCVCVSASL